MIILSGAGAVTGGSDPDWASVVFLSHFDGTDGQTAGIVEETGKTLTCVGNAQLDTSQFKWGTASAYFDGTGDYISAADSADWAFGLGNWTVEGWFRWDTNNAQFHYLIGQWNPPNAGSLRSWALDHDNVNAETLELRLSANGSTNTLKIDGSWAASEDVWYHIAADWDGTTYRNYVDGVVMGTATTGITLFDSTGLLAIGSQFIGWADDVRITKGVARYAGAFTPPTAAFPNS
jgi:hypothetical protein